MDITVNPECERCGKCCDSYSFWMTNRKFDDDPTEIKRLMEYHNVEAVRGPNGELGVKVKHTCIHLEWVDGLAKWKIYDTRPLVCQEYSCRKIIEKAIAKAAINGIHL